MTENRKTPKLRFKGFTDAWEQRKLGDLAEIRRGLTYKPGDVKASGIRVLRSSNINEEYFEIYEDDVFVDEVAINIPYVKKGDIIITSANGSSRLVGKHAIIKNIQDNSMVHGGFMLVASADEPEFLNSSMSSPWYTKFINIYVAGGNGAIGNLSKNDLDNQEILVPSIAEQQKIGTYFRTIDNLITLHQRKLDRLKKIKKSMLDKMFPKDGEVVPEIRFKGFTDAWEQRKLGEFTISYSGGTPSVGIKEYYNGQIPFIRSAEINSEITELFLTEEGLKNSSARLVDVGDILYALYGATSGEVGRARLKGAVNQAILVIKPHKEYDSEFLTNWLRKNKESIVETYLQGGQGNLSGTIVKELLVCSPSHTEQEEIGSFFYNLDSLITLHQRKLDKLKNIKKSMLDNMFV